MQDSILANLTSRRKELNDFAQEVLVDLVKIPTVNPSDQNYLQALSFVRDIMEEFGLKTEIVQTPDWYVKETEGLEHGLSGERLNLIAKNYSSEPEIVMNAHIDTVLSGAILIRVSGFSAHIITRTPFCVNLFALGCLPHSIENKFITSVPVSRKLIIHSLRSPMLEIGVI
jgi:hypothetical protein